MIEALVATLNAGLDADEVIADRNTVAGLHDDGESAPSWPDYQTYDGADIDAASDYIERFRPRRMRREVKAKRDLMSAILAEPHDYIPGDEFYSCSQAVDPDPAPGEGGPGSGCSNEERAGQPCDCGRDERVERLLRIMAQVYDNEGDTR